MLKHAEMSPSSALGVSIDILLMIINPYTPKSDDHLISESHMQVLRIEEMITDWGSSWLIIQILPVSTLGMYREQYGEYAYWCQGVEG